MEVINDMMCIILRGRWCSIIVLNVQAPCEDKSEDVKGSFCEEIGRVFGQFCRYYSKNLLGDFYANVDREGIFKHIIGSESSHEIINGNGVRVVNFSASKTLLSIVQCSLIATFEIRLDLS
jgi:hypothetical protein